VPEPIPAAALYRGYSFPAEIISYAVWLHLRFSLSLRDVDVTEHPKAATGGHVKSGH
jgi:transposase-like protein